MIGTTLFDGAYRNITVASFTGVKDTIARGCNGHTTHYTQIWGTHDLIPDDHRRKIFRPTHGTWNNNTTRGNLDFPQAAQWFGSPGKNKVYTLNSGDVRADQSQTAWMQDAGICGEVKGVSSLKELRMELDQEDAFLYGCDDYGPSLSGRTSVTPKAFNFFSSKWSVNELVGSFVPFEMRVNDMHDEALDGLFEEVRGDGFAVVLKTCNIEHGGMGVSIARSEKSFKAHLQTLRSNAKENDLDKRIVLQRGQTGRNRSFTVFITPNSEEIAVVAITDQIVDEKSGRDLGNHMYPLTKENVEPLAPMILELVKNAKKTGLNPFGFLMCDFIQTEGGDYYMIDPGLRPSAAGSAAMAMLWLHEGTGRWPYVQNTLRIDGKRIKAVGSYKALCEKLSPALTDPSYIKTWHEGVLPYSISPYDGLGRLLVVAPSHEEYQEVEDAVVEQLCCS